MSDHIGELDLTPESRGEVPGRGRMSGRRVLVVGGGQADYNIEDQPVGNGRAISMLLAREGAKVVVADYDQAAADGTVEAIVAAGGEATAMIADVRDAADIEELVSGAGVWLGGLDGVVYNVGIPGPAGFENMTPAAWDNTMNVNLRGAMLTCRAALPIVHDGSAFVFTSSIAALGTHGTLPAYDASKAGMSALMLDVAGLARRRSIRANIVMPGDIDTGLARNQVREVPPSQGAGLPGPRRGTAWEIAYATVFLLSNEAAYITGQTLVVDGGASTV